MVKSASDAPLVALSSGCIKRGAWLLPGALQASWSTVLGGILIVRDPLPTVADENPRGSRNVQTLDTEVPSKVSDTISHGFCDTVSDVVGETVGDDVVGDTVGDDVGDDVVGDTVGDVSGVDVVGDTVGDVVGDDVVGDTVGDNTVGDSVGDDVVVCLHVTVKKSATASKPDARAGACTNPACMPTSVTERLLVAVPTDV